MTSVVWFFGSQTGVFALRLRAYWLRHRDFCLPAEQPVTLIVYVHVLVNALEQRHAGVQLDVKPLGKPDFVIHARLLHLENRTLVQPRHYPAERQRVSHFGVQFHPTVVLLVDPEARLDFGEHLRLAPLALEPSPRRAVDHPGLASIHHLAPRQAEIVRVEDLPHKGPILLALLLVLL